MLEVAGIACARGDHQLFSGLSFTLAAGELLQVQGANGSGKTTLLRTLCGFVQPVAGEINWHGRGIHELGEAYFSEIAYLGHANAIKDDLNALENLHISCALSGYPIAEKDAISALRKMGLRGKETYPVKVLSQGQRRRVALARLLISQAPLWILDEPLTALDVGAVALMQDVIGGHLAKQGMVIFTTHQPLLVPGVVTRSLELR